MGLYIQENNQAVESTLATDKLALNNDKIIYSMLGE